MRTAQSTYKTGAIEISQLQNHDLKIGMKVEIKESLSDQGPNGKKQRWITGEVICINDRIFTLSTEFRRIESFHLSDLIGTGKLELRRVG